MNDTLNQIKTHLYEVETILSTNAIVGLLDDKNIDTQAFLKTIKLYMDRFDELASVDNTILLNMLNKKLAYFSENAQDKTHISVHHTQLATSITFIQDKAKLFFKNSNTNTETARVKKDINLALKSIEEGEVFNLVKSQSKFQSKIILSDDGISESTTHQYKNLFSELF